MQSGRTHSGPTLSEQPSRRNILIFGDVGVGKSSLVNLITGKNLAMTSADAWNSMLEPQEYIFTLDGVEFALYDTPGINEPDLMTSNFLEAICQAHALVSKLERSGGINLLVLVTRRRITGSVQQNYKLFTQVLCTRQVPVIIVVTNLENEPSMEGWWERNEHVFERYSLKPIGHACVTTTRGIGNVFIDRYEQSQKIIRKLLLECSGRKESWFGRLAPQMRLFLSARRQDRDLKQKLINQCGFSRRDANLIVQRIEQSQKTSELPRDGEEIPKETRKTPEERPQDGGESQKDTQKASEEQPQDEESQSDTEEQSWSWSDERFGYDSSFCVSLPILH